MTRKPNDKEKQIYVGCTYRFYTVKDLYESITATLKEVKIEKIIKRQIRAIVPSSSQYRDRDDIPEAEYIYDVFCEGGIVLVNAIVEEIDENGQPYISYTGLINE